MGVPFLDLKRQYESIRMEVEDRIRAVLKSQAFILGSFGKSLEEEVADALDVPHAIGVASGTDALLISLKALGLRPGEGVLTSSFTFFATGGAVHNAGGRPFFADIDPETFNLSPEGVRSFLEEECGPGADGLRIHKATGCPMRVLLPVHLYGQCADMEALNAIASEFNLKVLEDACQAFGARYQGRAAGALGDAGAFSFFPTKNLGGAGDGGMITTHDSDLAALIRRLRVHGSRTRYVHEEIGYNSRLDEIQAAVLLTKLSRLKEWNQARAGRADLYRSELEGLSQVTCPAVPGDRTHIYHQCVIRAERRDALKAHLEAGGIGAMIYYQTPLHLQPCFRFLGLKEGDLPETESACSEVLALPIFAELTDDEVREVCGAIRSFYAGTETHAG